MLPIEEEKNYPVEPTVGFDLRQSFPLLQTPAFGRLIGRPSAPACRMFEEMAGKCATRPDAVDDDDFCEECYQSVIKDFPSLLQLLFVLSVNADDKGDGMTVYERINGIFKAEVKRFFGFDVFGIKAALLKLPCFNDVSRIIYRLADVHWDAAYADKLSYDLLAALYCRIKTGKIKEANAVIPTNAGQRKVFIFQHGTMAYWMGERFRDRSNDAGFARRFFLLRAFYLNADRMQTYPPVVAAKPVLSVFDYGCAYSMKLISAEEFEAELTSSEYSGVFMREASETFLFTRRGERPDCLKPYPANVSFHPVERLVRTVVDRIIDAEILRGREETPYTRLAAQLGGLSGAALWVRLLKALGNEGFCRPDNYHGRTYSKREVLCAMIRGCTPADDDTADILAEEMNKAGLSAETMASAAVIVPCWLPLAEEATNTEGLQSTAAFFHAHAGMDRTDVTAGLIKRYARIPVEDINNGAFDLEWFRNIGSDAAGTTFKLVLAAARFITTGAGYNHIRESIGAVRGRMSVKELQTRIKEKRSKEQVMDYGLVPLGKRSRDDLMKRYDFLMKFRQESKGLGSQRQSVDEHAVDVSLFNLAQTAGYSCVERLVWDMETERFKEMTSYMQPLEKEGVRLYVKVDDETGEPYIRCVRAGRGALVSLPAKLRNDPYVGQLKDVVKRLKNPYLQQTADSAMRDGQAFLFSDLLRWAQHPVLARKLAKTFFGADGGEEGFFSETGLSAAGGQRFLPKPDTILHVMATP